jgi:hypothetical protein
LHYLLVPRSISVWLSLFGQLELNLVACCCGFVTCAFNSGPRSRNSRPRSARLLRRPPLVSRRRRLLFVSRPSLLLVRKSTKPAVRKSTKKAAVRKSTKPAVRKSTKAAARKSIKKAAVRKSTKAAARKSTKPAARKSVKKAAAQKRAQKKVVAKKYTVKAAAKVHWHSPFRLFHVLIFCCWFFHHFIIWSRGSFCYCRCY